MVFERSTTYSRKDEDHNKEYYQNQGDNYNRNGNSNENRYDQEFFGGKICKHYAYGKKCKFAENCRFEHIRICKQMATRNECSYGTRCKFSHDLRSKCRYENTAQGCKFGETCKFGHVSGKNFENRHQDRNSYYTEDYEQDRNNDENSYRRQTYKRNGEIKYRNENKHSHCDYEEHNSQLGEQGQKRIREQRRNDTNDDTRTGERRDRSAYSEIDFNNIHIGEQGQKKIREQRRNDTNDDTRTGERRDRSAYSEIDFNNMYTSLKEDIKQSTQDQIAFLAKQISGQIQEIKNQQPYMQRYAMPQATHAIQQSIPTYQIQQQ